MKSNLNLYYLTLEIKTFGLGSGIQDMSLWDEPNKELECQSVRSLWCFWPLTGFSEIKIKNKRLQVTAQTFLNKFIEMKFSVGCMVSQPNHLLQRLTAMSLINEIPNRKENKEVDLIFFQVTIPSKNQKFIVEFSIYKKR